MMEALTLNKAMELYELLGAHIPEVDAKKVDVLDFIGKIVEDINASNHHEAYTLSIELMSGKTLQDLQEMDSIDRLELFTKGLIQNKILSLKSFCDKVGF